MILFTNLPETLLTINFVKGLFFGKIPLTLLLGVGFASATIFLRKKIKQNNDVFAIILIIFWLPLFANFFYNLIYDARENFDILNYDISKKRIVRICNIDNRQNLGGFFCKLLSYVSRAKSILPDGTAVRLAGYPALGPYYDYFFYPDIRIVASSSDLLLYFSRDTYLEDDSLYKLVRNKDGRVERSFLGRYEVLGGLSKERLILKEKK